MFHNHRKDAFQIDIEPCSSAAPAHACGNGKAQRDLTRMRKTAGCGRARDMRRLISRVAHYLGDLAESRHATR
tara:strand:+ start:131 stop:349 length:219 start_codon:yes stop_codon:yes gene_type:complete